MIELNLTYEESKKILDLGYDFGKVCIDWSTEHTKYIKVGSKLIEPELVEELELAHNQELHPNNVLWNYSLEFSEVESKIQDFINPLAVDWITYYPPIPVIPKAALEECLPTTLSFGFNEDVYLTYEFCDKEFQYRQSPDYYCSDGKTHYSSKSAYEAFIWCHNNYPEELKAKFEEVMR